MRTPTSSEIFSRLHRLRGLQRASAPPEAARLASVNLQLDAALDAYAKRDTPEARRFIWTRLNALARLVVGAAPKQAAIPAGAGAQQAAEASCVGDSLLEPVPAEDPSVLEMEATIKLNWEIMLAGAPKPAPAPAPKPKPRRDPLIPNPPPELELKPMEKVWLKFWNTYTRPRTPRYGP